MAILLNNCPKTSPQLPPGVYHHYSRSNLAVLKQILNHYSSQSRSFRIWITDLFSYHAHHLLQVWHNYKHVRGRNFRSRAGS